MALRIIEHIIIVKMLQNFYQFLRFLNRLIKLSKAIYPPQNNLTRPKMEYSRQALKSDILLSSHAGTKFSHEKTFLNKKKNTVPLMFLEFCFHVGFASDIYVLISLIVTTNGEKKLKAMLYTKGFRA